MLMRHFWVKRYSERYSRLRYSSATPLRYRLSRDGRSATRTRPPTILAGRRCRPQWRRSCMRPAGGIGQPTASLKTMKRRLGPAWLERDDEWRVPAPSRSAEVGLPRRARRDRGEGPAHPRGRARARRPRPSRGSRGERAATFREVAAAYLVLARGRARREAVDVARAPLPPSRARDPAPPRKGNAHRARSWRYSAIFRPARSRRGRSTSCCQRWRRPACRRGPSTSTVS